MELHEYAKYDATGLVELIHSGQVSAAEVQATAREAICKVNPQLNAVVGEVFERPLEHDPAGPFLGTPFVLKDELCHAAGVPQRSGSRLTGEGITFDYDTYLMARFKRAGLAIMALTTLPELGFNANTAAIAYGGSTHNPWDTALSPGGSSGGTAALVAARAVPMGYANDGGGSIRIPAAMNGLVGLKPSRGRISLGPDYGEVVSGLGVEFALMRTMRDCALLLDQVAGSAPGDPSKLQAPERPYVQEVGADPGRLKVAFTTKAYSGVPVDSEVADATVAVAKRLASLGHEVEEASPTYDTEAFHCANVNIWSATVAEGVLAVSDLLNVEPSHDNLEATTFACYEYGKTVSAMQMAEAHSTLNAVSRQLGDFFTRYDLLVTPTLARPPFPLGLLNADDPSLDADGWTRKIFTICPFTCIFNATGQPAISLPLGHTESRLPIGVQLAAPMSEEAMLIRVGSQLEETMPWRDRCPIVHVAA